ncbi:MAG: 50S ribosomal protein L29 [Patescibacteria group bacterium]
MKLIELRAKSDDELKELYNDLAETRRELSFRLANNQLKNVREFRKVKQTMAQILTLMTERKQSIVEKNNK